MGEKLAILFYFVLTGLNAQVIDKTFVDNWIKSSDPQIQVDSVQAYYFDNKLYYGYDIETLNARLSKITPDKIRCIWYSRMKTDDYVPGKGKIAVMTVKKKDTKEVSDWLNEANGLFNDKYISYSQHVLTDSKDPVLVIDGKSIQHTLAKQTLEKINPRDIYDISVNNFFPVPWTIYGKNSKNGLIQIWTKIQIKE